MTDGMRVTGVGVVGTMPVRGPEELHLPFDAAAFLGGNRIAAVRGPAGPRGVAAVLGQSVRALLDGGDPAVDVPTAARFVCDFDVLAARLATGGGLDAVLADADATARALAGTDADAAAEVRALAVALRRSSGVLRLAPDQLPEQALLRLGGRDGPLLGRLVRRAAAYKTGRWLRPVTTTAGDWRETVTHLGGNASAVCFAPDGRLLVVDSRHRLVCLDLAGAAPPLLFGTGDGEPTGLACDGARAAVPTRDGPIEVVDLASGRRDTLVPAGGGRAALAAAFARPGLLVTGGTEGRVRLWDVAEGVETGWLDAGEVSVHALLPLDGDRLLVGTGPDATSRSALQLWDLAARRRERAFAAHDWPVTALAPGDGVVVAAANDELSAWRLADLTCAWRTTRERTTYHSLACLGGTVLAGDSGGALRLFALDDGAEAGQLPPHSGLVPGIAVDAPRGRFVTVSYDQTVRLWDVAAAEAPVTFRHQERVTALAPAPGDLLVSGSKDGRLLLWDARTGAGRAELGRHDHWVSEVVALPGGRAVSAGWDGVVRLWDLERAVGTGALATGQAHLTGLAVTRDGRTAVTADTDGVVRVWDLAGGERLAVSEAARDDRVVALAVAEGVVRWTGRSGRLFTWRGGGDPEVSDALVGRGRVTACRWGAGGVVVGLADGRVVRAGAGGAVTLFGGAGCGPTALACDPGGAFVLAAYGLPHVASDNTARLWTGDGTAAGLLVGDLPWTAAAVGGRPGRFHLGDESGAVHVVEAVPPGVTPPGRGPGSR